MTTSTERTLSPHQIALRWKVELSAVLDWMNTGLLRRTGTQVAVTEVMRFESTNRATIEAARKPEAPAG